MRSGKIHRPNLGVYLIFHLFSSGLTRQRLLFPFLLDSQDEKVRCLEYRFALKGGFGSIVGNTLKGRANCATSLVIDCGAITRRLNVHEQNNGRHNNSDSEFWR